MSEPTVSVEGLVDLVDRVRDYVNQPRVHATLYSDTASFNRACSAMDMIGDTAHALRAYLALDGKALDLGTSYLVVFGVLQVLYVQQDAVFWLCKALGFPRDVASLKGPDRWIQAPGNDGLAEVRRLRNSSVGHPVNRDKGPEDERGSYFIARMSVSGSGFQLIAANAEGNDRWIDVDIPKLIRTQVTGVEGLLSRSLAEIQTAERAHRERFKGQPLAAVFSSLGHPIEKLHHAARDSTVRNVGVYGLESVRDAMQRFRERLSARGEPFGEDLEYVFRQLDGGLSRLADFYESRSNDSELAQILATFVADRVEELVRWARSNDAEYEPAAADRRRNPTAVVPSIPGGDVSMPQTQ